MINIIWAIFGVLFLVLSIFHILLAFKKISFLTIPDRFKGTGVTFKVVGQDFDQPVKDLIKQLNLFLQDLNKANFKINLAAAIGYFLASCTAFFSFYLVSFS